MESEATSSSGAAGDAQTGTSSPTCIIVLGMAGSGKTTFVQVTFHFGNKCKC